MNVTLNSGRVNRLRTARGITQADLADTLGLAVSVFNRIENGSLPVEPELAVRLAHELDCSTELLELPLSDPVYTRPWLRAYADAPKKIVDVYIADTLLAWEAFESLRLRRVPERLPLFRGDPQDDNEIEEFALEVRQAAGIDAVGEVPNVTRAAERLGCIVLPLDSDLGRHLGLSIIVDNVPVLRASRPASDGGVPGDRQRFTLSHELGHVAMHASIPPPATAEQAKMIEKQANRFAASFLLPGDSFLEDLDALGGRVTLTTLAKLKARWGVAVKAMVVRLQSLHRIDADQARSLYKQISARDWNRNEPVEVGNERAVWVEKALAHRFPNASGHTAAAANFGLGVSYYESWTSWLSEGSEPASNVLTFERRN